MAGLLLACPILAAVSVASVAQIVPDFDDGDWDGPDDDGCDEKKLTSIGSQPDGHLGYDAFVLAVFPTSPDLPCSSSRQPLEESLLAAPIGERHEHAVSFRGPPLETNASRRA